MIIPTEYWLGGVRMPNPIEIMAQDMNLIRQSLTAVHARLESTQAELSEVKRAKSSAEQLTSNETGFSVEEMRDPLTNLVEWLNKPKTLNPSAQLQEIYNNRENPAMSTTEQTSLVMQRTKDKAVLRKFINEGPKYVAESGPLDEQIEAVLRDQQIQHVRRQRVEEMHVELFGR